MTLYLACPVCAARFPAEAGIADAEARRALGAAIALWPAPLKAHALTYFGLHAPAGRKVVWPKLVGVVSAFVALIESGQVTRNRETRPAPLAAWGEGLTEIMAMRDAGTLQLPLKGHGLLEEIVHRRASQVARQQAASARPLHPSHRPAPAPDAGPTPAPSAPPAPDWTRAKAGGVQHVGALLGALKGVAESGASLGSLKDDKDDKDSKDKTVALHPMTTTHEDSA